MAFPIWGGSWSPNERVDDAPEPTMTMTYSPSIAVDASGNAYAVWYDPRNGNWDIYFSYRLSGGSWSTNEKVDDAPGTTSVRYPSIAVDASGNAYAVWNDERNGDSDDIYFSYRPSGGSWTTNQRVDDAPGTTDAWVPNIAVDTSGNAYAVWHDNRNGSFDIYFSYLPSGGSWSTNERVDDALWAHADAASIAVDASGNAYAVWNDKRNGNLDIYFSYRPSGGSWSPNERVDDAPGTTNTYGPSIAVDASGNAYAVWQDTRNVDSDIYFSYRPSGGSWSTNEKVDDAPGTTGAATSSSGIAVAVDASGNAYAVWMDDRNGNWDIYFSYRPSDGSWSPNKRVDDAPGTTWAGWPTIAVDGSGNAYAVWEDIRNRYAYDIYFSWGRGPWRPWIGPAIYELLLDD